MQNASGSGYAIVSLPLPSSYTSGKCRIIASGFEVTNATADLTSQGMVTVYRSPVPEYETSTALNIVNVLSNPTLQGSLSAIVCSAPPGNIAEAMLLPGSRQWKAKDGAYCVQALNSNNIPTEEQNNRSILFLDSQGRYVLQNIVSENTTTPNYATNVASTLTKFDISGAYFTGLSNSTTLTVTWNVFVERFPSVNDTDLVVLANPSPQYCPAALEAYAHCIRDMPVGVPVAENGLGDWFNSAIGEISKVMAPVIQPALKVAKLIPTPMSQAIASAGKMLAPGHAGPANLAKKAVKAQVKPAKKH